MPDSLLPQTFYGLVREHLPRIEQEIYRGVRLGTVLASLPVTGKSLGTFRNALFHARRRTQRSRLQATCVAVSGEMVPVGKTAGRFIDTAAAPDSHLPVTLQPMTSADIGPASAPVRPRPAKKSVVLSSQRDFLDLVRSTSDTEIF
jgi:hypothetical protein